MFDTLWIDVEDLFGYAAHHTRLSGIQRVAFEISRALWEAHGDTGRIRFVRYDPSRDSFRRVPWSCVAALLEQLSRDQHPPPPPPLPPPPPPEPPPPQLSAREVVAIPALQSTADHPAPRPAPRREPRVRQRLRRLVWHLPAGVRIRLVSVARLQWAATRASLDLVLFIFRGIGWRVRGRFRIPAAPMVPHEAVPPGLITMEQQETPAPATPSPCAEQAPDMEEGSGTEQDPRPEKDTELERQADAFAAEVRAGDIMVNFSASWTHPDYARLMRNVKRRHGVAFACLVHDIIPLRHPEWFERPLVRIFRYWADSLLPLTDHVLATSRATARDVERYLTEHGIGVPNPIQLVPIGTGFTTAPSAVVIPDTRLPSPGGYVLFVSTIEARKNHMLLFRVWRRMLAEMPPASVPLLVFAGRVGWLVDDLMRQLENCDHLDGKIVMLPKVTDAELASLYHGCLFTVFPSLYEGWGLPVSESLSFGKPCVASNSTSIPEAGGPLTRYFDPNSVTDAHAVIRATIEDREGLRAWEEEVKRSFVPVPWRRTADAVLRALDAVREPTPSSGA